MIFFCIIAFLVKCFFWRQVSYFFFLARQVRLFSPIINEFHLQEKCVFCNFSTIIALVIFLQKHDKKKRIKQIIQWSPFMLLLYWLYLWGVTLRTCGLLLDSILKTWSPKISFLISSCLLLQYYLHHLFGALAYLEKWENGYVYVYSKQFWSMLYPIMVLYMSLVFGSWEMSHSSFLKVRKKRLHKKLSKFMCQPFSLKKTT